MRKSVSGPWPHSTSCYRITVIRITKTRTYFITLDPPFMSVKFRTDSVINEFLTIFWKSDPEWHKKWHKIRIPDQIRIRFCVLKKDIDVHVSVQFGFVGLILDQDMSQNVQKSTRNQIGRSPGLTFQDHSRSNLRSPLDSPYTSSYLSTIVTDSLSVIVFELYAVFYPKIGVRTPTSFHGRLRDNRDPDHQNRNLFHNTRLTLHTCKISNQQLH